jgi:hypothetical protein
MEKNKNEILIWIACILILLGFIAIFIPYDIWDGKSIGQFKIVTSDYDKLGNFVVGVSTPFLTAAAFILVFSTYRTQQRELIKSKEHIENKEFITLFFNMMDLLKNITSDIQLNINNRTTNGLESFSAICSITKGKEEYQINTMSETYRNNFHSYSNFLSRIIQTINSANIDVSRKNIFYQILSDSLTFEEITLISTFSNYWFEEAVRNKINDEVLTNKK